MACTRHVAYHVAHVLTHVNHCPQPGALCTRRGAGLDSIQLLRGYWRASSRSADIRRCPDGAYATSACVGGNESWPVCKEGTAGVYCSQCAISMGSNQSNFTIQHYYDSSTSSCQPCVETWGGAALGFFILFLTLLMLTPVVVSLESCGGVYAAPDSTQLWNSKSVILELKVVTRHLESMEPLASPPQTACVPN